MQSGEADNLPRAAEGASGHPFTRWLYDPQLTGKLIRFGIFMAIVLSIVGVIFATNIFLVAPAYAVTAYLVVYSPGSKYADPRGITACYLFVILSTIVFQRFFGVSFAVGLVNLAVVALFVSFSPYTHPPALALTLFSYLSVDPRAFLSSTFIALGIVLIASIVLVRVWQGYTKIESPQPIPSRPT